MSSVTPVPKVYSRDMEILKNELDPRYMDGIQLLDNNTTLQPSISPHPHHSFPRPAPLQILKTQEKSWVTSIPFLTFQRRKRTEWTTGDLTYNTRMDKSPSIDSGRGTSQSLREERHKRCFTANNLDSSPSSSIRSFPLERSDSETMLSTLDTDRDSPVKKSSTLPSFMRRSTKKPVLEEEAPSPAKGFKRFTTGRRSLFQKKDKNSTEPAPPLVRDFRTLKEESQPTSPTSGSKWSLSSKNAKKNSASSTSLNKDKDKEKEAKTSPSKKSSFVKGFSKFIKSAASASGGKGPGTAAAASLPAVKTLEGTSATKDQPSQLDDLLVLSTEPKRIQGSQPQRYPTPPPQPLFLIPQYYHRPAAKESAVDDEEVLTRVQYSTETTTMAEQEPDPNASKYEAILESQILRQLKEEQEAKDRNSLEIKKLRRKKKNKARMDRQLSLSFSESESIPDTEIPEKPNLELESNSVEDEANQPVPPEVSESPHPLQPIVYLSHTDVVSGSPNALSSSPMPVEAENRDRDADSTEAGADADSNVEADGYGFNPGRRRSSGPLTESFKQLEPFNFGLDPIEEGKRERLYKVLVVGELGTGKTSIIKRYVHQFFSQHYRATIGVDFALKVLRWDPETVVRLQLWDIAGQERFGSMTRVYYKEAVGAFVVFDVTRGATLEAVPKWKADLDSKVVLPDGRPIPTVLLANKSDQPKEGIAANREKMNEFCQQQGFSAWFETSAKDNINIDESANFLVSKILEMDKWSQEPSASDPEKVDLNGTRGKNGGSPNCAC